MREVHLSAAGRGHAVILKSAPGELGGFAVVMIVILVLKQGSSPKV
ncbi:hypothetical protein [Nitritalea halalkaliphila]|nr:hypothetical protein [Nitritalea halalkaliphila]